jgi:hypothetical protein
MANLPLLAAFCTLCAAPLIWWNHTRLGSGQYYGSVSKALAVAPLSPLSQLLHSPDDFILAPTCHRSLGPTC